MTEAEVSHPTLRVQSFPDLGDNQNIRISSLRNIMLYIGRQTTHPYVRGVLVNKTILFRPFSYVRYVGISHDPFTIPK